MPRPIGDEVCLAPLASAEGAHCYTHSPLSLHLWLLRQQLHSSEPQHALGRRDSLLQHARQRPPERLLQKSGRSYARRHPLLVIAGSTCASARSEAKSPSAEATRAAPPSFIALPREIAPVSRPLARSSKGAPSRFLFASNVMPPFTELSDL
jgi:hypothetical protein